MAVDYFLKIEGIEGESTDAKHKDELEPESFGWGVTQTASTSDGRGAGTGKPLFRELDFVQRASKSSATLFLACATGQHLRAATLTARTSGKAPFEFLTIRLADVRVSSFEVTATGDEHPREHATLSFARIEITYRQQGAGGKALPELKAGYDLKLNRKL